MLKKMALVLFLGFLTPKPVVAGSAPLKTSSFESTQQNHELNLEEVKFRQQVDKDHHKRQQAADSLAKMAELQEALINRRRQEEDSLLSSYESAVKIKRAQQEQRVVEVDGLFKRCLITHRNSQLWQFLEFPVPAKILD